MVMIRADGTAVKRVCALSVTWLGHRLDRELRGDPLGEVPEGDRRGDHIIAALTANPHVAGVTKQYHIQDPVRRINPHIQPRETSDEASVSESGRTRV